MSYILNALAIANNDPGKDFITILSVLHPCFLSNSKIALTEGAGLQCVWSNGSKSTVLDRRCLAGSNQARNQVNQVSPMVNRCGGQVRFAK